MQRSTPGEQIEQIKNSILKFGNNDPIAVWGDNNIIVEGHGRYTALQQLGYEEVECIRLDHLTEEERRAYTLAHNKLTMNSGFDMDVLTAELEQLQEMDFDISLTGFEIDKLKEIMGEIEPEPNFDELEKDMDDKEKVIVQITFSDIKEWKRNENELREVVENMNATIAVKMG